MYNEKSIKNLNPGKAIVWNDKQFKSFAEMSRVTGFPKSTIQDYFHADKPYPPGSDNYMDEINQLDIFEK